MVSVNVDVDLGDVLDDLDCLSKRELRDLRNEANRLLGGAAGDDDLGDINIARAYRALEHLRAGEISDARWELERAFTPPVTDFLRSCFVEEPKTEGAAH
jgi:hypothetical protein